MLWTHSSRQPTLHPPVWVLALTVTSRDFKLPHWLEAGLCPASSEIPAAMFLRIQLDIYIFNLFVPPHFSPLGRSRPVFLWFFCAFNDRRKLRVVNNLLYVAHDWLPSHQSCAKGKSCRNVLATNIAGAEFVSESAQNRYAHFKSFSGILKFHVLAKDHCRIVKGF